MCRHGPPLHGNARRSQGVGLVLVSFAAGNSLASLEIQGILPLGVLHRRVGIDVGNRKGEEQGTVQNACVGQASGLEDSRRLEAEITAVCGGKLAFKTAENPRRHRELHCDRVASGPRPCDLQEAPVVGAGRQQGAVDPDLGLLAPAGNADVERKPHVLFRLDIRADALAERIIRRGRQPYGNPGTHQGGDRARAIQRRGQPVIAGCHPHVHHVVGNDAVDGADAAQDQRAAEWVEATARRAWRVRLLAGQRIGAEAVGRLVVAHGLEVAGDGGGGGIEEGTLHAIAPIAVALDAVQPRRGQEHRGHVARLRLAKGADSGGELLAGGHAVGEHVLVVQPFHRAQRGLQLLPIARPRIDQGGQTDVLVDHDHVARRQQALAPIANVADDVGLGHGRQGAVQDPPLAAERIGLQHGVEVAQPGHPAVGQRHLAHLGRIIGINLDQGLEHPLVAAAQVECDQGTSHLRVGPAVELLGLVAFLPVDQRRAEVGLADAVDDRVEPARIFRIKASSCRMKPRRSAPSSQ